jgi:hypothetical protein
MSGDRGRHLTLVVPGLFGPATASADQREESARQICEGLSLPALEHFLSRCTAVPCQDPEPGLAALLFGCFGVAREGPDWPVAAVTGRFDGAGEDAGWWLRADPVHLRVDLGELVLVDSDQLRISTAEARALRVCAWRRWRTSAGICVRPRRRAWPLTRRGRSAAQG